MSPLSASNACFTSFEIANESCVTSTTSVGGSSLPPQPATASSAAIRSATAAPCEPPCHAAPPGLMASRTPSSTEMRASSDSKTFETPRLEPGSSVSPRSGYARPSVVTPTAGPLTASNVMSSPGFPRIVRRSANDVDVRIADARVDLRRGVAVRPEQEERRELVVEPSTSGRKDEDSARAHPHRDVEGELEIGRILFRRVTLDAYAGRLGDRDGLGRRRVEVADGDGDLEAEREGVLEPLVCGDDGRAERNRERGARGGRVSA